eukprot:scaffold1565_cov221-Amphora_coffeaeformis.AAC.10
MFDKFLNPVPMLLGLAIIVSNLVVSQDKGTTASYVVLPVLSWLLFSRTLRMIPHIIRKPSHIVYIPAMILFQYFFVMIKVYAVCTLHITDWGSRPTVARANATDGVVIECSERKDRFAEALERFALALQLNGDDVELVPSTENFASESYAVAVAMKAFEGDSEKSTNATDDESTFDDETKAETVKFVPWYKRPAVLIGAVVLSAVGVALVFLGLTAARHRFVSWEMDVIANDKSLSSDRATGAGMYDPVSDSTFIAYAGPYMDPTVVEYSHATHQWMNKAVVAKAKFGYDYHDYPRIVMADDGQLVVVYTNSPETLHISKAHSKRTSTGLWNDRMINDDKATYPCLIKATSGNLYLFYRHRDSFTNRPLKYVKSTDHGETWSDPVAAIDIGNSTVDDGTTISFHGVYSDCPRLLPAGNDMVERFAFGWTMAGADPGVQEHNTYHKDAHFAYFFPSNDTFANAGGHTFGSMIDADELKETVVYDTGSPDDNNPQIVDYYFAPTYSSVTGKPMIIFNYNRTLIASKWDGSQWVHNVALEHASNNLFDLEKIGEESVRLFVSQGDVLILESHDFGQTWKTEHQIVASGGKVGKVFKIPDSHSDISFVAHENNWDLFHSDQPEKLSYLGSYKVWVGRQVEFNPISKPKKISSVEAVGRSGTRRL